MGFFSPDNGFLGFFFQFLNGFFQRADICNFNEIQFITYFSFVVSYFGVRSKKPWPIPKL